MKKVYKIIMLLILLLVTSLFEVYATETDVPTVSVKVNQMGMTSSEHKGDVGEHDNVLTRVSDALLAGDQMYTNDSVTSNELNGTEPGKTITGDMGCNLQDSNGNPITSMKVQLSIFVNVDKATVADTLVNSLGEHTDYTDQQIRDGIMNKADLISSTYGMYSDFTFDATIDFSNGQFTLNIPADFPDNYVASITAMQDPVTGEMINISEVYRLFIAMGEGELSNMKPPEEETPPPPSSGKWDFFIGNDINNTYSHRHPNHLYGEISSEQYDVGVAIPTSENLTFEASIDDILYHIQDRIWSGTGSVEQLPVYAKAEYLDDCRCWYIDGYHWEDGKKVPDYDRLHPGQKHYYPVSELIISNHADSHTNTWYDVPTSDIWPAEKVKFYDTPVEAIVNVQGGSKKDPDTISVSGYRPGYGSWTTDAGKHSNYNAAITAIHSSSTKSKAIGEIKDILKGMTWNVGECNYDYRGLLVTTGNSNGVKPEVYQTAIEPPYGRTIEMIPSDAHNGEYDSKAAAFYENYVMQPNGFEFDVNNVVVHTPVINLADISWKSDFINQKITKTLPEKYYLMLDEQFTIMMPNGGQHENFQGYGNRDYNSKQAVPKELTNWGKIEDIRMPFDVYIHSGTEKYLLKANTWLSDANLGISTLGTADGSSYTFTIPIWVTEKEYDIETRIIAENAKEEWYKNAATAWQNYKQDGHNASNNNYIATKTIHVEVIGKIYDLRVSASNDPGWENKIWSNKKEYVTSDNFPFGQPNQNRIAQYKYAPKLGYSFVFDFKTKGRKSNQVEATIIPTINASGFYYTTKDGKETKKVDLYYKTTAGTYRKIKEDDTYTSISVRLNDALFKVPAKEFVDSNRIYSKEIGINKIYNYKLGVNIGTFAKLTLPHAVRLCYDNFSEYIQENTLDKVFLYGSNATRQSIIDNATANGAIRGLGGEDNVIGAVGHWYAGYRLPNTTVAIPENANINEAIKNNSFLKDGFILVKMDIITRNTTETTESDGYLRYLGPEAINEAGDNTGVLLEDWTKETIDNPIILPNGQPAKGPHGTIAIFDADSRASNDVEIGGTH